MKTRCESRWAARSRTTAVTLAVATALAGSLAAREAQERLAATVTENLKQIQVTLTDLQNTAAGLDELRNQSGDLRPAYDKFSESVEKTRVSSGEVAKLFEVLSADGETYFGEWLQEIETLENNQIKKASSKRLKAVQKQYDELLEELETVPPLFAPMMSDLDDLKTALGMDLTPAGLKALTKAMNKTDKSLGAFQKSVVDSLAAFDQLVRDLTPEAPVSE